MISFENEKKETPKNIKDSLWVEKYRPHNIDDIVLDNNTKNIMTEYINNKEIPHLLFYGPPGCGKSTIARILVDHITPKESDVLVLNGSEQRGIEIVRNGIIEFLKFRPLFAKHRIVFIDEADALTDTAFSALRKVFEEFYENGRFILTCNYIHKIPDPIRSRCTEYQFKELPLEFIMQRCIGILNNENTVYNNIDIEKIINQYYPDFRKIIQTLQKFSNNGQLRNISADELLNQDDKVVDKTKLYIIGVFDSNPNQTSINLNAIIQIITEHTIDYIGVFKKLFLSEDIPPVSKIIINKYLNSLNNAVIPSMHYTAFLFEIMELHRNINSKK